jgi:hypothetical protein
MFRRLRDGNPCLNGQLEDLKHFGKMTFRRYKEYELKQLEESSPGQGQLEESRCANQNLIWVVVLYKKKCVSVCVDACFVVSLKQSL